MMRLLHSVHRNENGQAVVYTTIMLMVLALFLAMVINIGQSIHFKMQAQNAADAAALAVARNQARGLNVTGYGNLLEGVLLVLNFTPAKPVSLPVSFKLKPVRAAVPWVFPVLGLMDAQLVAKQNHVDNISEVLRHEALPPEIQEVLESNLLVNMAGRGIYTLPVNIDIDLMNPLGDLPVCGLGVKAAGPVELVGAGISRMFDVMKSDLRHTTFRGIEMSLRNQSGQKETIRFLEGVEYQEVEVFERDADGNIIKDDDGDEISLGRKPVLTDAGVEKLRAYGIPFHDTDANREKFFDGNRPRTFDPWDEATGAIEAIPDDLLPGPDDILKGGNLFPDIPGITADQKLAMFFIYSNKWDQGVYPKATMITWHTGRPAILGHLLGQKNLHDGVAIGQAQPKAWVENPQDLILVLPFFSRTQLTPVEIDMLKRIPGVGDAVDDLILH
jgi:hypothetical protein